MFRRRWWWQWLKQLGVEKQHHKQMQKTNPSVNYQLLPYKLYYTFNYKRWMVLLFLPLYNEVLEA